MVRMKSKSTFQNAAIVKPDGTHMVQPGETFETNWLHGKELVAGGLAEPTDPQAFEKEPTDAVQPHYGLSAPDHASVNERRAKVGKEASKKPDGSQAA